MALYYPPTANGLQKTLGAQLDEGTTASVTLNNTTSIQNKAGVFVVDRVDTGGTEKAAALREYISFTGVSGSTLTGLTRGLGGGGADQDHAVGAVVEFISDVVQQDGIMDALDNLVTSAGALDTTKVVDLTTAQTLTTKTLTTPVIASFYQDAGKTKLMTTPNTASDTLAAIAATQTLTNKTLTTPIVASFYQDAGKTKLMTTPDTASDTLAAIAATQTLTNKRINPRVVTATDDATAVIDCDVTDQYQLTAIANATEFTVTGTPVNGQKLVIRLKDAGVGKGLTWTGFTAVGVTLPTTTVANKTHYIGCIYNSAASTWDAVAVVQEA